MEFLFIDVGRAFHALLDLLAAKGFEIHVQVDEYDHYLAIS